MNYYRRYCGDYAADTPDLSLAEHGAYTLLLDAYYTAERPLPHSMDLLYRICRAMTPAERKAVQRVADQYFPSDGEMRHNARADKEIGIAAPKLEKLRKVAQENGKKGGRKPKPEPNPVPEKNPQRTQPGSDPVLENNPSCKQPPTASHQPSSKPNPPQRSPESEDAGPSTATTFDAALETLRATARIPLAEARIDSAENTPAGTLSAICIANGIRINPFHPLCQDWARDGVSVTQIKDAIATARERKPKPENIPAAYLDTILKDRKKPAVDNRWRSDDNEAEKLCHDLGIPGARVNEQRLDWHNRITNALRERARSQVQ